MKRYTFKYKAFKLQKRMNKAVGQIYQAKEELYCVLLYCTMKQDTVEYRALKQH